MLKLTSVRILIYISFQLKSRIHIVGRYPCENGGNINFRITTDSWKNKITRKQKGTTDSGRRKEEGEKREKRFLICGNTAIHEAMA